MIGRGGKRTLVALTAMVGMKGQPEGVSVDISDEDIPQDEPLPLWAVLDKPYLDFYTVCFGSATSLEFWTSVNNMFVSSDKRNLCVVKEGNTEVLTITPSNQFKRVHTFEEIFDKGWWSPDNSMLALVKDTGELRIYARDKGF